MAEGRMLKRNISISKKLPQLKTDSARMLWTWIIPFLDVEGRYYASPDLIKANIVPRLKTFTEANITQYLQDMADIGLIIIYETGNETYLQYRNFDKFQSIRKDHEGKPLPAPPPNYNATTTQLQENSPPTTGELPLKLSKVKLSKVSIRARATPLPFDFKISDRVKEWAKEKELNRLEDHLESFKGKCTAKGYEYVNWDAAFMGAIRENWAGIENGNKNNQKENILNPFTICPNCKREIQKGDIEGEGCIKCMISPAGEAALKKIMSDLEIKNTCQ